LTGSSSPLSIRRATGRDVDAFFEWANDPVTRANSFSPKPIGWPSHCSWFETALGDPRRLMYVVSAGPDPIAHVRFDRWQGREAEISMSLGPQWRGRRLSAPAIRLGSDTALNEWAIDLIHAFVKPGNEISLRAFRRAGYAERGTTEHKGCAAVHLIYQPRTFSSNR
jgi:RimJ/RimL family protein N-acetyltransferase